MSIRKVIQIGSSVGVTLPKEVLEENDIQVGDEIEIGTTSAGVLIKRHQGQVSRIDKITALTLDFVERYRDDLESLANR